ncbi:VWA domain containing CoxE-like protein [Sporotomaculum syntrophicum]|uniref:VWA domain containing CoxE-like protein n=1 Tax=Sporotomaculum syntrophicum TaxID=182264 RepID=A0A9D3AXH8_9FIRM|nr:VWA domain-containing protein [Sporotomaculum syntrophicum]KAF1085062.1 VWA domain containing CoxE-like protein [Sporotomaculum syntrophicum]
MFVKFFYELRNVGVPVSLNEWLTLMEALNQGIGIANLDEFYLVARSILVKSETQFDNYDLAFQNYFSGIETPPDLVNEALAWLYNGLPPEVTAQELRALPVESNPAETRKIVNTNFRQDGNKATKGGGSRRGGSNPKGVRLDGAPGNFTAMQVAARRNYRGFRGDMILGVRKFEAALRVLRQLTNQHEGLKNELDINLTIDKTCRNAGRLELVWDRPRKNNLKILLLMDSGGSMDMHINLCSRLFTAFKRSSHLKELKIYYFHNCIYDYIYEKPNCSEEQALTTYDFLRKYDDSYRLIIIGDASMAESELMAVNGAIDYDQLNSDPGVVWLERFAKHFSHNVWLNPIPAGGWDERMNYRARSINMIRQLFPMYELSVNGLEQAVKRLKVSR